MPAATATGGGADLYRIGTVRIHFTDLDATDLVVPVPPHAGQPGPAAAYLRPYIEHHVLMFLPLRVGPQDYTVTLDLRPTGEGTATVTEVLRGAARVRRQPEVFGHATIGPEPEPEPEKAPAPRARRRR